VYVMRKIGKAVLFILGSVIPSIAFLAIFITFLITIASRYIFKHPVPWSYEFSVLGYMWTMFFGVGLAIRNDEHVTFGLVYDSLRPMGRLVSKIAYNLLLIALLAIIFLPSVQSLITKQMVTGVLNLPYKFVFAPFLFMLADSIVRSAGNIWRAIREYNVLAGGAKE
jgi:TRAP-type transport system small permease protein